MRHNPSQSRLLASGLWLAVALCVSVGGAQENPDAAVTTQSRHTSQLIVRAPCGTTKALSADRFAELPRSAVEAPIPHTDRNARYEGVLLEHLLREVGVQAEARSDGSLELPRRLRSAYVLVEAADGYQAVFSLSELLSELGGHTVLVADREDGKPLPAQAGPYRLVEISGGGYERWVRQVRRVLVQPGSASPFPPTPVETTEASGKPEDAGGVYLVGTGPGDPDQITLKAARILRTADVVFCYDWMKDELAPFVQAGAVEVVSPLLQGGRYFRAGPEQYSGEELERANRAIEELARIKARVAELVADGKTVAFADNGDPMLFSPWAWIPEQLREFDPVVIPGLSSFNAGNAAVQRSVAGLGFVTLSSGSEIGSPDEHGRLSGTIVFFTHKTKLNDLLPRLRQQYPDDTPVAIVCQVSYPGEKVIQGTLGSVHEMVGDADLPHLYLVYVGDALK
jgi:precorrin-4/cobalt-precorrin-4 C11-methyltransferase